MGQVPGNATASPNPPTAIEPTMNVTRHPSLAQRLPDTSPPLYDLRLTESDAAKLRPPTARCVAWKMPCKVGKRTFHGVFTAFVNKKNVCLGIGVALGRGRLRTRNTQDVQLHGQSLEGKLGAYVDADVVRRRNDGPIKLRAALVERLRQWFPQRNTVAEGRGVAEIVLHIPHRAHLTLTLLPHGSEGHYRLRKGGDDIARRIDPFNPPWEAIEKKVRDLVGPLPDPVPAATPKKAKAPRKKPVAVPEATAVPASDAIVAPPPYLRDVARQELCTFLGLALRDANFMKLRYPTILNAIESDLHATFLSKVQARVHKSMDEVPCNRCKGCTADSPCARRHDLIKTKMEAAARLMLKLFLEEDDVFEVLFRDVREAIVADLKKTTWPLVEELVASRYKDGICQLCSGPAAVCGPRHAKGRSCG